MPKVTYTYVFAELGSYLCEWFGKINKNVSASQSHASMQTFPEHSW